MHTVMRYIPFTIQSFRHRGLRRLYEREVTPVDWIPLNQDWIALSLTDLDVASRPGDCDLPGFWSISISGNWGITLSLWRGWRVRHRLDELSRCGGKRHGYAEIHRTLASASGRIAWNRSAWTSPRQRRCWVWPGTLFHECWRATRRSRPKRLSTLKRRDDPMPSSGCNSGSPTTWRRRGRVKTVSRSSATSRSPRR